MFSIHNLKEILTGFQETNQRLVHLANNVIDNPIHLLLQNLNYYSIKKIILRRQQFAEHISHKSQNKMNGN